MQFSDMREIEEVPQEKTRLAYLTCKETNKASPFLV